MVSAAGSRPGLKIGRGNRSFRPPIVAVALWTAAECGHLGVVNAMLDAAKDPIVQWSLGKNDATTAVDTAVYYGHPVVVEALIAFAYDGPGNGCGGVNALGKCA